MVTGTPNTLMEYLQGKTPGFLGPSLLGFVPVIEEQEPIRYNGPIIKSLSEIADLKNKIAQNFFSEQGKSSSSICCSLSAATQSLEMSFL